MMYRAQLCTADEERIVTDLEKCHFVTLETDMMMAGAVENNLPGLPLEQFTALMSRRLAAQDRYDEIRQIFSAFDARCCGFLTLDDFKRAFADVTPHLPEQTVTEAFREVDRDLDGHVSFKDFEIVMRHE
ncbi:EF-hand calcium-binding domain-containing protein 11 isoform X3 [Hemiscyllium ocellatum]|uniref:EF-hand calcium-binding domain-containing protein 11 isoform X3 n=1 Tax=Hemiscyllium ocellatum TaxID=170820 RepID=UPI0029660FD2|nr:EF-hand calcium-binding domain-containing protein 11 isoform X3 [Hemiscyllium ocellatum]